MIPKLLFLYVSLGLYVVGCLLPAYQLTNEVKYQGYICLLMGFFSFTFNSMAFWAWFANVLYVFSLSYGYWKGGHWFWILLQLIGIGLSLIAFSIKTLPLNEAGHYAEAQIGLGTYFWVASFVMALVYLIQNTFAKS